MDYVARPATLSRRSLLTSLAAGGAVVAAGCTARAQTPPRSPAPPPDGALAREAATVGPALAARHTALPLPFRPSALRGLSERLIVSHHEKNYQGAVRNLNRAEQELSSLPAEAPPFVVAALRERELLFRNSKGLHEAYFGNLGGDGRRGPKVEAALAAAYGTVASWEEHFRRTALGLGGGSGWVVLALELDTGQLRTAASTSHAQQLAASLPLLVLDMYEHSYQMDYGADAARYVDAFFENVQWEAVERRLERARRAVEVISGQAGGP